MSYNLSTINPTCSFHSNQMTITSKGFQFLLQPPHEQLWDLLKHSLEMSEVCCRTFKHSGIRSHIIHIISLGARYGCSRSSRLTSHAVNHGTWSGKEKCGLANSTLTRLVLLGLLNGTPHRDTDCAVGGSKRLWSGLAAEC